MPLTPPPFRLPFAGTTHDQRVDLGMQQRTSVNLLEIKSLLFQEPEEPNKTNRNTIGRRSPALVTGKKALSGFIHMAPRTLKQLPPPQPDISVGYSWARLIAVERTQKEVMRTPFPGRYALEPALASLKNDSELETSVLEFAGLLLNHTLAAHLRAGSHGMPLPMTALATARCLAAHGVQMAANVCYVSRDAIFKVIQEVKSALLGGVSSAAPPWADLWLAGGRVAARVGRSVAGDLHHRDFVQLPPLTAVEGAMGPAVPRALDCVHVFMTAVHVPRHFIMLALDMSDMSFHVYDSLPGCTHSTLAVVASTTCIHNTAASMIAWLCAAHEAGFLTRSPVPHDQAITIN